MTEEQVRQIAQQVYQENQTNAQFAPTKLPLHIHNGVDSPTLDGFYPLGKGPSTVSSVVQKFGGTVEGNTVAYPIPIIFPKLGIGFQGGYAPAPGTLILTADKFGNPFLFVSFDTQGGWAGIELTATP